MLQRGFVALAADCDDPEREVAELALHLQGATMLPFVLFADSDGHYLGGSSGAVNPERFRRTLEALLPPS
jgi:hypothetical protein